MTEFTVVILNTQ